jgi:glyoxylase-like metal-dependent hydrolase (beta-lactamase superfamily II)
MATLGFEVIGTPGHTDGSVSYLVELGGKRIAFTGDLICGPGQIWEMYSLQKQIPGMLNGYVGFGWAYGDVKASLDRVLERKPDLLVPSHGVVMTDPPAAVAQMKSNIDALMDNFLSTAAWRVNHPGTYPDNKSPMMPAPPHADYPEWFREISSTSKAIVAEDKSVFLFDCGNQGVFNKLAQLKTAGQIGPIEALWITHYHDDHTDAVNTARRRFGCKVWVQRAMVDIIENPTAYNMPCLIPESIHVQRIVEDRETFEWKGFRLTGYYFPGQTLYHAGLLVEKDGFKLFLSGDSFSNWGMDDYCSENRVFLGRGVGYLKCLDLLLEIKPDIMVSSHWGPIRFSASHVENCIARLHRREELYGKLLPYDNANFGLDPYWFRAYPYRQKALPGTHVEIEARVMNHSSKPMKAQAMLNLPAGWAAGRAETSQIPARSEGRIRLSATAPREPARRHQVLGLSAVINGKPLGEFAETIIDFLV